ncbi:MAG: hypothetical protein IJ769_04845 [Clostridia bacterium]|nr:hypothetical protein [Clostridia bacterium]
MGKERLTRVLDVAMVVAILWMLWDNVSIPYERTLAGFWSIHNEIFRTGASIFWLAALWLGGYRAWDRAERASRWTVLASLGLLLGILTTPYFTRLIIRSYNARLSQIVYGGCMIWTALCSFLLFLSLGRANADVPECVDAAASHRRALIGALCILAAGLTLAVVRFRQAMWYAVAVAALYLLIMWLVQDRGENAA